MFHYIVKIERVCHMIDMVEVGAPWYELVVNDEMVRRFETAPTVVTYGNRLTPVASDGEADTGDVEGDTRPAPEHDG